MAETIVEKTEYFIFNKFSNSNPLRPSRDTSSNPKKSGIKFFNLSYVKNKFILISLH